MPVSWGSTTRDSSHPTLNVNLNFFKVNLNFFKERFLFRLEKNRKSMQWKRVTTVREEGEEYS